MGINLNPSDWSVGGTSVGDVVQHTGDALGNFPQAFTHVGLINAALSLHERENAIPQLAHREQSAERPGHEEESVPHA